MVRCDCKDCTDRTEGCHSACEKYKAYKQAREVELEARRKHEDMRGAVVHNNIHRARARKGAKLR